MKHSQKKHSDALRAQRMLPVLFFAMMFLSACSDSGGTVGGTNRGSIALDDGKVYPMVEQHRYEVLPSVSTEEGDRIETWNWASSAFRSGALTECEGREGFTGRIAASNLSEACSVAAKCNFSFDQSQVTTEGGLVGSRFVVDVPVLKAPVGLSYQLKGVTEKSESVSTTATFCLVPVNEAPVAENDSFTVVQGETFQITASSAIHLLSNDADDVDASNQALRVATTAIVPPQFATQFSLRADGGFTYLFSGDLSAQGGNKIVDTFKYQITDGTYNSTADVRITVVSRDNPPIVSGTIPSHTAVAGIPTAFDFSSSFSDPEGSQLQFSVVNETLPANSNFEVGVLGVLSGTAVNADIGNHTVTVTASDGVSSVSSNFLLTVVENRPPEGQILADQFVDFGALISLDVAASFTDPEGQSLVYALSTEPVSDLVINPQSGLISGSLPVAGEFEVTVSVGDGFNTVIERSFTITQGERPNRAPVFSGTIANQGVTIGETAEPSRGDFSDLDGDTLSYSLSSLPSGMAFDTESGVLSGAPDQLGVFNLVITAIDAEGARTDSNTFTITVIAVPNAVPQFGSAVSDQTVVVGELITAINVPFTDPEGAPLSYTASSLPPGLTIDAAGGDITGIPTTAGTFSVQVTAEDSVGDTAVSNIFTITVNPPPNTAPVFTGTIADQTVTVGTAMQSVSGNFSDIDDEPLTYSATGLPANVSINSSTGVVSGTPSTVGSSTVVITAADPSGEQAKSNDFLITVNPVPNNAPSFAGPIPAQSGIVGSAITAFSIASYFGDIDAGDTLVFSESPTNGLPTGLSLSSSGVISGVPTSAAIYSVIVIATDNASDSVPSAPFTFTISASNVAPVIGNRTPAGSVNAIVGIPVTVEFDVTDESPSTLTYSTSSNTALSVVAVGDGEYSVTGLVPGTAILTFTVTDDQGLPDTETVAFVVAAAPNAAPQITSATPSDNPLTVQSGTTQGIAIVTSDEDVSSLVYSAVSNNVGASIGGLPVASVSIGAGGNFSINGLAPGTAEVTLTATDDALQVANYSFVVNVPAVNQPPVILSRTPADDPITDITIADTDPVQITVSDEVTATLVYSAESSDELVATVVSAGAGLYQITGITAGTSTITLTVTDEENESTDVSFDVEIAASANQAPVLSTIPIDDVTVVAGAVITPISVTSAFSDPEGDTLTYTAQNLPPGLTLASGIISGTPDPVAASSTSTVTITATDVAGSGNDVDASFDITVDPEASSV